MIGPDTKGSALLPLMTGQYTRVGQFWIWTEGETIHISDTIGAVGKLHKVGRFSDRLSQFRDANGVASGRDELVAAGYSVGIESEVLIVKLRGKTIYTHRADDRRDYWRYAIRGWRTARKHHRGMDVDEIVASEEYWWKEVVRIERAERKPFWKMTKKELEEWRKQ